MLKITADTEIDDFYDTPGVYAYFKGGYMTDDKDYIKKRKKDAIGVAVIADVEGKLHRIVLDKTDVSNVSISSYYYVDYGGSGKSITGATITTDKVTALKDIDGRKNTVAISDVCHGYNDGSRTGSAAEDCQARFNGKGHMPSIGEWKMFYDNKDEVDKMMSIIGGTALGSKFYWSSTLYHASAYSWGFRWIYGNTGYDNRRFSHYVRAVMEF